MWRHASCLPLEFGHFLPVSRSETTMVAVGLSPRTTGTREPRRVATVESVCGPLINFSSVAPRRRPNSRSIRGLKPTATITASLRDAAGSHPGYRRGRAVSADRQASCRADDAAEFHSAVASVTPSAGLAAVAPKRRFGAPRRRKAAAHWQPGRLPLRWRFQGAPRLTLPLIVHR